MLPSSLSAHANANINCTRCTLQKNAKVGNRYTRQTTCLRLSTWDQAESLNHLRRITFAFLVNQKGRQSFSTSISLRNRYDEIKNSFLECQQRHRMWASCMINYFRVDPGRIQTIRSTLMQSSSINFITNTPLIYPISAQWQCPCPCRGLFIRTAHLLLHVHVLHSHIFLIQCNSLMGLLET